MSKIPVATELGRKDRVWPAVTASIAVHAVAIAFAIRVTSGPAIELEQMPIKAKLVRLGEKKPEAQLPRKEVPPAPPEPAPAAPAPPEAPPPPADTPPPPTAMPAPTPTPAPKPAPARSAPARNRANGSGVDALLARTEKELQHEKLYGDPEGSPFGDSDEGSTTDSYQALVAAAVMMNYQVPETIPVKDRIRLRGWVTIFIEPNGRIAGFKIADPSGDTTLDAALERAIRATARVPPPPQAEKEKLRTAGMRLPYDAQKH